MSFNYRLKFDSEQVAKDVLRPFGFVSDSVTFGPCWAVMMSGRHRLTFEMNSSGYFVYMELNNPVEGLDAVIAEYGV